MFAIGFTIGVFWMWVWSIILLWSQQFMVTSLLKLNYICLAVSGSSHNQLLGDVHITFVIAANFRNNFWGVHKIYF